MDIAGKLIEGGANVLLRDQVHHTLTLCSVECVCVCVCVCVCMCVSLFYSSLHCLSSEWSDSSGCG